MELRDRILAGISTLDSTNDVVEVDIAALVHRLLLFEQVVLESIRLREVPALVRAMGSHGLLLLLESGALRVSCDAVAIGQIGQLTSLEGRDEKGVLPLGSYSFAIIQAHDRREYLSACLQEVHRAQGLGDKETRRLKRALMDHVLQPPDIADVDQALMRDVVGNGNLVLRALRDAVESERHIILPQDSLRVTVRQLDDFDVRVETNLQRLLSVDLADEHQLVTRALLGVGGLNLRIATMRSREGVAAFRMDELPLLDDKFSFLLRDVLPVQQERRFERVLDVVDLPEPDLSEPRSVNVERLLELRATAEANEFRTWLRTSDGLADDAIRDLLPDLRQRLGAAVRGRLGRTARFAVSTGAGLAAGDITGAGAGAVDSFILERLLPRPGPLAWLAVKYPSVFEGR